MTSNASSLIVGALNGGQAKTIAPGALERIGEAVARFGWRRLLLCTSNSQRVAGHVATVSSLLGKRIVASYDHVQSHVLEVQVAELLALALQHNVDAVIALGGGSPIGMAKAISHAIEERSRGTVQRPNASYSVPSRAASYSRYRHPHNLCGFGDDGSIRRHAYH